MTTIMLPRLISPKTLFGRLNDEEIYKWGKANDATFSSLLFRFFFPETGNYVNAIRKAKML